MTLYVISCVFLHLHIQLRTSMILKRSRWASSFRFDSIILITNASQRPRCVESEIVKYIGETSPSVLANRLGIPHHHKGFVN